MVYTSTLPKLDVPDYDVWELLFENPSRPYPDDHVLMIDAESKESLDYSTLRDGGEMFGRGLLAQFNWQKGDQVMIVSPNNLESNIVIAGVIYAGGIVASANPADTVQRTIDAMQAINVKVIVAHPSVLNLVLEAASAVNIDKEHILLLAAEEQDGMKPWTSVTAKDSDELTRPKINPKDDPAFVIYTSGTTGVPKAAFKSHATSVTEVIFAIRPYERFGGYEKVWKDSKAVAIFPFYLSSTYTMRLFYFWSGMRFIIFKERFDFVKHLGYVQDYKCTEMFLAPPLVRAMAFHPVVSNFNISTVRAAHTWGDVLDVNAAYALYRRLEIRLHNQYGMIEASILAHTGFLAPGEHGFASCGPLLQDVTAKIVDTSGAEVPAGTMGRLLVTSRTIAKRYLNHPSLEENLAANNGFLDTDDFAVMHDGLLYVHSRIRDAIQYEERVVRAVEIERVIMGHPLVQEVVVKGTPGEHGPTADPKAFVVLKEGTEGEGSLAMEIEDCVRIQTEMVMWLRGGVKFLKAIPKSPGGKVLRNEMV